MLILLLSLICTVIARRLSCDDLVSKKCEVDFDYGSMTIKDFNLKYRVAYPRNGVVDKDPVLLIHGGPGSSHLYFEPMKYLACYGRKVIMYDQLGSGASDWPDMDENPWIKTIDYYVEEAKSLLQHLNVSSGYHIYGHSWGGIVAQDYAIKYGSSLHEMDPNLRSVTISGIFIREKGFIEGIEKYILPTLPPFTRNMILRSWKNSTAEVEWGAESEAEWLDEAAMILDFHHGTRTVPPPTCVLATEREGTFNTKLYVEMQGPNEYSNGGVLSQWDRSSEIGKVKIPMAATTGQYDTMTREVVRDLKKFLPSGSKIKVFPAAGHASMVDQPDMTNDFQNKFMNQAEEDAKQSRDRL
eukprot:GDKJ01020173.1.p1 GENE.GDKJ01020173.1~~GDKJ01020173.1.p1  ORF type:complete len:355 (+),score=46.94 GDKJ01020173.1:95-1159(+)